MIEIRKATPEDAEGILRVHRSAVHETAAEDYPANVLDAWSPPVDAARIERHRFKMQTQTSILSYVAVDQAGQILGFAELVPPATLGAVYVAGPSGRKGVASALLAKIEATARLMGISSLSMSSSVTAAPFYAKHGFREIGRGIHRLSGGQPMESVKMEKFLGD